MNFPKQARALERAKRAMAAALNEAFPVGTRVAVRVGRGYMLGRIVFDADTLHCEVLRVRSDNGGQVHHKHYSYVEYA